MFCQLERREFLDNCIIEIQNIDETVDKIATQVGNNTSTYLSAQIAQFSLALYAALFVGALIGPVSFILINIFLRARDLLPKIISKVGKVSKVMEDAGIDYETLKASFNEILKVLFGGDRNPNISPLVTDFVKKYLTTIFKGINALSVLSMAKAEL